MQQLSKILITGLLLGLFGTCMALRDPFTCTHTHSATFVLPQNNPTSVSQPSTVTQQSDASEWRIINEKEGSVVMQHKDGSIREITMSNN